MLKVIYRMLQAALLWYNKFRQELEKEGFEFNPYDLCVGNQTKNGSQHTIRFHVDDVMSSHINPKVNDDFDEWLQANYGEHGKVKVHRGKVHDMLVSFHPCSHNAYMPFPPVHPNNNWYSCYCMWVSLWWYFLAKS